MSLSEQVPLSANLAHEADSQKAEDKTFFGVDSEKDNNQHMHEQVNIERSLNKLKE